MTSASFSLRVQFSPSPNSFRSSFSKAPPTHVSVPSGTTKFLCSLSSSSDEFPINDNNLSNFCIIEGPETVQDFSKMQTQEIQDNIRSRRNKIFLLMEEVRRLRVQQRLRSIKNSESGEEETNEMPEISSSIPFFSHVTPKTLRQLYLTSLSFISGIIVFGGLIAPTLELKLGLGGTSYEDFIRSLHLPLQLRLFSLCSMLCHRSLLKYRTHYPHQCL